MLAACTATLSKRPSVSTRIWRLRPVIFLPASKPCGSSKAPFLRALDALAVDDCRGRARLPSRLLAYPQVEIGPYCALRRKVFGQRLPLAAGPQHVENSVQNLAHVNRALAAAGLGRRDHRLDNRPFVASQITRITKTAAVSSNAMFRLPHRALPRESSANTESQPIRRTQQLPGSALSVSSDP